MTRTVSLVCSVASMCDTVASSATLWSLRTKTCVCFPCSEVISQVCNSQSVAADMVLSQIVARTLKNMLRSALPVCSSGHSIVLHSQLGDA